MDPQLYSKNNIIQTKENCYTIDKYFHLETWKEEESVLEIGMGDGKFSVELFFPRLPKNVKKYVGSDISEKMVEFAKEKYKKDQYPNIEFMALDPQDDISSSLIGQFDRVVSFNTFHFFSDATKAIKNIFSMLKPGGELMASFLEKTTLGDIFYNLSKHPKWGAYGHDKYLSNFFRSSSPQNDWKYALTEAGFVNIKMFSENRVQIFDKKTFEDFFLALDPILSMIPVSERGAYLSDYLQEARRGWAISIERNIKTGEENFIIKYRMLFIRASADC